jgi:hypothetical protein
VASARQRSGDVKVIATSALIVLAVGGLILGGILLAIRGGHSPACGRLTVGSVDSIRTEVDAGPYFQSGGGSCGFILALDGSDIVAYKIHIPGSSCTVKPKGDGFQCGGKLLDRSQLRQYPTSIESVNGIDALIVDLRTPADIARDNSTSSTTG